MKRLPRGIQEFERLRERNCVYADKTELIYQLISDEEACFLSRPRRFGKSLLVSTLAAIFRGDRELFDDLWIATTDYAWPVHPVIRLDFSLLQTDSPEHVLESLNRYLRDEARRFGVDLELRPNPAESLSLLLEQIVKDERAVILVDEYDRPIVRRLRDPELCRQNREVIQDFFAAFKSLQATLRFVFLTGVSRFSKVSLFSGLNSLRDLSFDPEYATLLGLTEEEIELDFSMHLEATADQWESSKQEVMRQMRHWYNGYRFAPKSQKVFNPWSVIQFLASGKVDNYWFSSATPTFAVDLIRREGWTISDLESHVIAGPELVESHDAGRVDLVPLLYQTGYLTIEAYDATTRTWTLQTPNEEVLRSLVDHLLREYSVKPAAELQEVRLRLRRALLESDMDTFFSVFNELLASVPYLLHVKQERFYHALLQMALKTIGVEVQSEVSTNRGRIDMVVESKERIYLIEFKLDQPPAVALAQIKETGYAEIFGGRTKALSLVGVQIDAKARSVVAWEEEQLE